MSPTLLPAKQMWSAIGSMALCVAMLIASEFMPVSLLTPIAADLNATDGMAGQAISISGLFAVLTSLLIAPIAGRYDRRHVLLAMTVLMLVSLVLIASAANFSLLMVARALLGMAVGGFWALSTATVIQLVPKAMVARALGMIYMGNAVATAFAAPIGAYLGAIVGWRAIFWGLVPLVLLNLVWQLRAMPSMPPKAGIPVSRVFALLKRRHVAFGMTAVMLTFSGMFATFTYLRPFLETRTGVSASQLSLLLLGLGLAGFLGTKLASKLLEKEKLFPMLRWLPLVIAALTLSLVWLGGRLESAAALMIAWGLVFSAIPVCWSAWLAHAMGDDAESGGGLMVAAIQLSIMLGGAVGGLLVDQITIVASFLFGSAMLVLASMVIGPGFRLGRHPVGRHPAQPETID